MTLNQIILETVVAAATAKAAGQPSWVRAIEKAAEQLITNPYISEFEGGLLMLSYSGETYHANGACQCKAYANDKPCWHRAAAQLVKRYNEAAQQAALAPAVTEQPAPVMIEKVYDKAGALVEVIEHGPELIERANELLDRAGDMVERERADRADRAQFVTDIKATWQRIRPFASYAIALHQHFGVTRLEDVPTEGLRQIHALLCPSASASASRAAAPQHQLAPRRSQSFIIVYRATADACAPGHHLQPGSAGVLRVRSVSSLAA